LCLGTTLFSAAMREYRVTAVRDAITTIWPPILDAMFDIFERKIARLLTADDTIAEIKEQFTS
jgi:nicotinamidase-related amidase